MMARMCDAPIGHAELRLLLELQPGPLYHHLDRLKLAGLVEQTGRDCYELTRAGREFMLAVAAIAGLIVGRR